MERKPPTSLATRTLLAAALAAMVAVATATPSQAVQITRGPYLQMGTPTSVRIRWRTDVPADSRIAYGAAPATLDVTIDDPTVTTEHDVALPGLAPDTRYYYAVGSTAEVLAGSDANHAFRTAPETGVTKDVHVWILGDSGTADSNAASVRDAYQTYAAGRDPNLWLMLGDNAYYDGTDAQYQAAVFDMYPQTLRRSVLWPTLGNHDGHSADSSTQTGPYYDNFSLPTAGDAGGVPSGTEAYYSFDYGNAHFICLESYQTDRSVGGAMLTWLEADLQAVSLQPLPPDWIVAFWHHPPYSRGSHDSDGELQLVEMRANVLPILESYGVDMVLAGHSHSYERSYLLDGHYGLSSSLTSAMILDGGDGRTDGAGAYHKTTLGPAAHEGAVYVVAGSSGMTSGGSLDHPAMYLSLNELGSVALRLHADRLEAKFISSTGATRDYFTITKGDGAGALRLCPATPNAGCRAAARSTLRVRDDANDGRDALKWRWLRGSIDPADLPDPTTTDYALCLYDQTGLLAAIQVPADAARWSTAAGGGFVYADEQRTADGVRAMRLRPHVDGRARLRLRALGTGVPPLAPPFSPPVTAQLVSGRGGICWGATYATALANQAGVFRAAATGP